MKNPAFIEKGAGNENRPTLPDEFSSKFYGFAVLPSASLLSD